MLKRDLSALWHEWKTEERRNETQFRRLARKIVTNTRCTNILTQLSYRDQRKKRPLINSDRATSGDTRCRLIMQTDESQSMLGSSSLMKSKRRYSTIRRDLGPAWRRITCKEYEEMWYITFSAKAVVEI
jgi:hypothetical protein